MSEPSEAAPPAEAPQTTTEEAPVAAVEEAATEAQPEEGSEAATEVFNSVKVSLADLCAKGTSFFAHKNYAEAADYYARASELQAELNGEMDPENAEILFLYGRSVFKVGQSKSDVLGGRAGGAEKKKGAGSSGENGAAKKQKAESELEKITEEGVAIVEAQKNGGGDDSAGAAKTEEGDGPKKPLFQFTGDENFEESDEEEAPEGEGQEEEEEEDDLAVAFEVLDLARVLFTRKLEQPHEGDDKGKAVGDSAITRHIKERLADTHDLLAEISLENERFPNAVNDFKAALALKNELYPEESEVIAEAHFKLSLALEFASITTTNDEEGAESDAKVTAQVDEKMREEAAKELEAAINSTKLKLQNKEIELATSHSPEDNDVTRTQIAEVKEVIAEMEQRLVDLRAPPVDVNEALNGPAAAGVGGILASALGESPAEKEKRIEEAKKTATDLTGLVRHKKKAVKEEENGEAEAAPAPATNGSKRKAEDLDDGAEDSAKKAKVEDA